MTLKLDISKAYDKVSGVFLQKLMEKMGFDRRWITLISTCISLVTYSILINGEPYGDIKPTRGIRQGDPLSPYLFLLCFKGLNTFLNQAVSTGRLGAYSLCKNGPKISHLFFADDSLLFYWAKVEDIHVIQGILDCYEAASGQLINEAKTTLFFSKLVGLATKNSI